MKTRNKAALFIVAILLMTFVSGALAGNPWWYGKKSYTESCIYTANGFTVYFTSTSAQTGAYMRVLASSISFHRVNADTSITTTTWTTSVATTTIKVITDAITAISLGYGDIVCGAYHIEQASGFSVVDDTYTYNCFDTTATLVLADVKYVSIATIEPASDKRVYIDSFGGRGTFASGTGKVAITDEDGDVKIQMKIKTAVQKNNPVGTAPYLIGELGEYYHFNVESSTRAITDGCVNLHYFIGR